MHVFFYDDGHRLFPSFGRPCGHSFTTPLSPSPVYTIRFFRWYIILGGLLHNQFHPSLPLIITRVLFPTLIHFFVPSSLFFFCNSFRYSLDSTMNPAGVRGWFHAALPTNSEWTTKSSALYAGDHCSQNIQTNIPKLIDVVETRVENFTTGALNWPPNDSVSEYFKFSSSYLRRRWCRPS